MKAKPPKLLYFKDNRGRVVAMPDNLTLEDLARRGIKVKLDPKDAPLPDGWYQHDPKGAK